MSKALKAYVSLTAVQCKKNQKARMQQWPDISGTILWAHLGYLFA